MSVATPQEKGTGSKSNLTPFVLPFAVFIALLAASPLLERLADPRWVVIARYAVAAAMLAFFWRRYTELHAPRSRNLTAGLLAIAAGVALGVAWLALDFWWARTGDEAPGFVPLQADGSLDPLLVVLRLAGFALVVPVMEELFWRSFLMRWIDRRDFLAMDPRKTGALALWLSSFVFALEHREWVAGLVAGLVFGTVYRWTGNLRACIASHASTNLTIAGWILATHQWRLW